MTRPSSAHAAPKGGTHHHIGSVLGFLPSPIWHVFATKHAGRGIRNRYDHNCARRAFVSPSSARLHQHAFRREPDEAQCPLDVYREIRAGVERRVKEVPFGRRRPRCGGRDRADGGHGGSSKTIAAKCADDNGKRLSVRAHRCVPMLGVRKTWMRQDKE